MTCDAAALAMIDDTGSARERFRSVLVVRVLWCVVLAFVYSPGGSGQEVAPNDRDSTFASDGIYIHGSGAGLASLFYTRQVIALRNGGVLALGGLAKGQLTGSTYPTSASVKLDVDGVFDSSFLLDGMKPDGGRPIANNDHPPHRFVAGRELADGSIVVVSEMITCLTFSQCGQFNDRAPTYRVQRYKPDGTLDADYGTAGSSDTLSHTGNAAVLSDGTVVALGLSYRLCGPVVLCGPGDFARPPDFDAMVVDARGQPAASLAAAFRAQMERCRPPNGKVSSMPLVEATSDDKVLFAYDACLLRLGRDSQPDNDFGSGGMAQIDNGELPVTRLVIAEDGSTLSFCRLADDSSYRVAKLLPSGLPDPAFGVNGAVAALDLPFALFPDQEGEILPGVINNRNSRALPILDAGGRLLIAGSRIDAATGDTIAYLARLDSNMKLDPGFGAAGTGLMELGDRATAGAFVPITAAVDSLDRIVVVGQLANESQSTPPRRYGQEMVLRLTDTPVVEYYNTALDHYFMTWKKDEIAKLDAGVETKGWTRTGYELNAFITPQPDSVPICRFYIPPASGDSHFFGRDTAECNATAQKFPQFVLEDATFMYMRLPSAGVCPTGTTPIYRVFSNRADANHRYVTAAALRDEMEKQGWVVEGDGPDRVAMCSPR
jgi:hypothetical protein